MVNENTFIVIPQRGTNAQYIYGYDIVKNEWQKILHIGFNFCAYSSVYNHHNQLLYICAIGYPYQLLIINLNKTKTQFIKQIRQESQFALFCIENDLHQIFHFSGVHQICDSNGTIKKQQQYDCFSAYFNVNVDAMIHLHNPSRILLFGGYDAHHGGCQKTIYKFSLQNNCNQFRVMNIAMPIASDGFGLTVTKNEQYIILIGGRRHQKSIVWPNLPEWILMDDIFIYDIKNNIFIKSTTRSPQKGCYHATMINDSNDELLSHGFVRKCYQHTCFIDIRKLPHYLIQLIGSYFCSEKIYLLQIGTGSHCKINVDNILV